MFKLESFNFKQLLECTESQIGVSGAVKQFFKHDLYLALKFAMSFLRSLIAEWWALSNEFEAVDSLKLHWRLRVFTCLIIRSLLWSDTLSLAPEIPQARCLIRECCSLSFEGDCHLAEPELRESRVATQNLRKNPRDIWSLCAAIPEERVKGAMVGVGLITSRLKRGGS